MNYWLISDTHFGHDKMIDLCGRPKDFSEDLLASLHCDIGSSDILIHLGDVCIGKDQYWHDRLMKNCGAFRKWLVLGNHDSKSNSWYLTHGWDFVSYSVNLQLFGKSILFSHIPKEDNGYDLNIHGHFHNSEHHNQEPELIAIKNEKQILIAVENTKYRVVNLKTIIEERAFANTVQLCIR